MEFQVVDDAVDAAAAHFNLRDTIQEFRLRAEETDDPVKKAANLEKGMSNPLQCILI